MKNVRSPIKVLEALGMKLKIKSYLIHFKGNTPYLMLPKHTVYYYAGSGKFRIDNTHMCCTTNEPIKRIEELYEQEEKKTKGTTISSSGRSIS